MHLPTTRQSQKEAATEGHADNKQAADWRKPSSFTLLTQGVTWLYFRSVDPSAQQICQRCSPAHVSCISCLQLAGFMSPASTCSHTASPSVMQPMGYSACGITWEVSSCTAAVHRLLYRLPEVGQVQSRQKSRIS